MASRLGPNCAYGNPQENEDVGRKKARQNLGQKLAGFTFAWNSPAGSLCGSSLIRIFEQIVLFEITN